MKTNIAVFFGGISVEHEVSVISGVQCMQNIDTAKYDITPVYIAKNRKMYCGQSLFNIDEFKDIPALLNKLTPVYLTKEDDGVFIKSQNAGFLSKFKPVKIDVAFPVVHGTNCEDGALQGFFELLGIPYIGCDVLASAIGMDKAVFKTVLKEKGVPVLDCVVFSSREFASDEQRVTKKIEDQIGYPLVIKPVNLGSSVGITKVENEAELKDAIYLACSFADRILAERAIPNLREINCSVLGFSDEFEASECEEPVMQDKILSYKDKYQSGGKKSGGGKGMTSLQRKLPADLSENLKKEIQKSAIECFKAIGGHGVARIDFLMDGSSGEFFVNEINTIPGSLAFYLWEAKGVSYKELINRLVALAFKRQRQRENLMYTIDTNILNGGFGGLKK